MREYSIPALVDIPATAGLADVVFTRASQDPHAVIMRRAVSGQCDDVTAGQFRDDVTGSYWIPALVALVGFVFALFININHASQHRIYRDRLMEVFNAEKEALISGEWRPARRAPTRRRSLRR